MRGVSAARDGRKGQRGLTLIEMLVAIAIMTVGVIGIAASFANIQRDAQVGQNQASLEATMGHVTDYLRSKAVAYTYCAQQGSTYSVGMTVEGVNLGLNAPPSVTLTKVTNVDSNGTVLPPLFDCASGSPVAPPPGTTVCPSSYCDWGVQRLTVTITSTTGRSLTRVVFKSAI
jgi:prepilin-type N-terminal cleavage/methylation domain-containing protein